MHLGIIDDAVADADGVVEAGQGFAVLGGFDPQAEPANLDGLFVDVHAEQVVLQNAAVQVEQGAMAAQLFEALVGFLAGGVELVEGFDEKGAAAAGRVENADRRQLVLPGLRELGRP